MERYVKNVGLIAGVALLLFFLVGVFSGASIGIALLRSTVSGIVVGAGTFGVIILVQRMLPGLVPTAESGDQPVVDTEKREGSRVNIVVDDDGAAEGGDAESTISDDDGIEDVPDEVDTDLATEPVQTSVENEDGVDSLVDEVQEQTAESAEALMQAAIEEERNEGAAVGVDETGVDEMPDIGAFAGSFVDSEYSENDAGTDGMTVSRRSSSSEDAGNDPAQIARAIRTLLNKDEQT